MTELPKTTHELRQLIERAQAELERLKSRPVPEGAIEAFMQHIGPFTNVQRFEIKAGLRAAYPILRDAWERPADDDGWIEWAGGECPVSPDTRVEVKLREGDRTWEDEARTWIWLHEGRGGRDPAYDIVAYRIVKGGGQ